MDDKRSTGPKRSVNWARRMRAAVAVLLLLPLLAALPAARTAPRGQDVLMQMATERPDATLGVIVQKAAPGAGVETLVTRLGGTITGDLHIINAFVAELPAKAVPELARTSGVRWVSLDAPVVKTGSALDLDPHGVPINVYNQVVGAQQLWAQGLQGQGIGVGVVDSGVAEGRDFSGRIVDRQKFNSSTSNMSDRYGHGTHVAGIIGGGGQASAGLYAGIAPRVNLVNAKVSDDNGAATASDVVAALQWLNDNRVRDNIRVVNISLNSSVAQSYQVDPLSAAAEILWFNGIVVVVSSGDVTRNPVYPPANDPFVITVGAIDDHGTVTLVDDSVAGFSGYGVTGDGVGKPDLVAPGVNIVSLLAYQNGVLASQHADHVVNHSYFRMSGTSMAAPIVAGSAALLLQSNPGLSPDQVKHRLMSTAAPMNDHRAGAGRVDVYAAVHAATTAWANAGVVPSRLLWSGTQPITWDSVNWNSVNWNSVNWNSVNWNSVNWNSVNWNSVNWNSDYWGD